MSASPDAGQVIWQGEKQQRRSRRLLASASAAVLAVLLVAVVAATRNGDGLPHPSPPAAGASAPTFTPDVTWAPVVGVDLPTSRLHGPHTTSSGTARGFSRSEAGAALAAVHILIRSGANAGPNVYGPTITEQVTGANAPAMKLRADELYEQLLATSSGKRGDSVPGADAVVVGYRVEAYNPAQGPTAVQVFLTSPPLQQAQSAVGFDVQLVWWHDDWRAIAPPRGDWGSVASTVPEVVDGLVSYGGGH